MRQKTLFAFFIGFLSITNSFGQQQKKNYYNEEWQGCSENEASFFRFLEFDQNGKPIGKNKSYYITGEKQCFTDGALFIDIK